MGVRRTVHRPSVLLPIVRRLSVTLFILGVQAKELHIRDQKNILKNTGYICTFVILEKKFDVFQPQIYGDNEQVYYARWQSKIKYII